MELVSPFIGTQYYRPPFPEDRYWSADLAQMRQAGLDVVQFWVCWGWVEPEPGVFRFDDYDRLMDEAHANGLGVVLSTIAEIHPFWVHRVLPGSSMMDSMGRTVVSSLRRECNVGLTPGVCMDHQEARDRMAAFLTAVAERYRDHPALMAWDIWNETRWAVQADGYVCYCPATLSAFRSWLLRRYGSLEGINAAWKRRYATLEDLMPGKMAGRPYTDLIEFEAFLAERAEEHMRFRAQTIRASDGGHVVSAHSAFPPNFSAGFENEQALCRGDDFKLAGALDTFGCSQFPLWRGVSAVPGIVPELILGARLETLHSATGDKAAWVSELQGAGARTGFLVSDPVDGPQQQRWVWSAFARGIKAVIFWCWRDEVFGHEASGFGLAGRDGLAASRLEHLGAGARVLAEHREELASYRPDPGDVGVLFSPRAYELAWAQDGTARAAADANLGWLLSLERAQLPYRVVDADLPLVLGGLNVLVAPWPLVIGEAAGGEIVEWVQRGGTLITEAEFDAYSETGFYRYGEDRQAAQALGIADLGRRVLEDTSKLEFGHGTVRGSVLLEALDPGDGEVLFRSERGEALAVKNAVGAGHVVALGSFPGQTAVTERSSALESLLREFSTHALDAHPGDGELVQYRTGTAQNGQRLLFVCSSKPNQSVTLSSVDGQLPAEGPVRDWFSGRAWTVERRLGRRRLSGVTGPSGVAVLGWSQGDVR